MLKIFLSLLVLMGAVTANAQSIDLENKIEDIVAEYEKSFEFHGNVEVSLGGQVIYSASRGLANAAFKVPHNRKSRFMIASVSKQFTAAAVLLLVQSGELNLDDLYSDYVPWSGDNKDSEAGWDKFTIRQLLTHTAQVIRDIRHTPYASSETYSPILSLTISNMLDHHNVFPVKRTSEGVYSNFGYMLLAHLVEKISKQKFHDFLEDNIFKPLGMFSTGQFHRMFHVDFMADGYNYPDDQTKLYKRCYFDATSFVGSHSLYSDMQDLMIWLNDLTSEDSRILSKELRAEMLKPHIKMYGVDSQYGFGVYTDTLNDKAHVWHDGMEYGYLTHVSVIPELDLKVVVLSNRHDSRALMGTPYPTLMVNEILNIIEDQN